MLEALEESPSIEQLATLLKLLGESLSKLSENSEIVRMIDKFLDDKTRAAIVRTFKGLTPVNLNDTSITAEQVFKILQHQGASTMGIRSKPIDSIDKKIISKFVQNILQSFK